MVEFLFLDLDDTILDFQKAERIALEKTFRDYAIEPTEERITRYVQINLDYWKRLERKEVTRQQVVTGRFRDLFAELSIECDPVAVALCYETYLSQGHYFLPGALEAVQSLAKKYRLYLASNGTAKVQSGRLKSADISRYFEGIFVSEVLGANKPDKAYFDRCIETIPDFDPQKAVMVGDSLTSDIQGGIHAGMRTVWINPRHRKPLAHIKPDFEIEALHQLEALLDTL